MNKLLTVLVLLLSQSSCCCTKNITSDIPNKVTPVESPEAPGVIQAPIVETIKEPEVIQDIQATDDVQIENFKPIPVEVFNHSGFDKLLKKHVSAQGNVNYKAFKTDQETLRNYISSLGDKMPNDTWTKDDKLAYWINAYNALTIDLILRNPSVKSIKDIDNPWDQKLWKLGDNWYDLNEIEHKILRKMNEPRIHFAIVCASISCPKLQNSAFIGSKLDMQLTAATKEFLNDSTKNKLSTNKIELSRIFKWFSQDFKQGQSLIDFLNKYSDIGISQKASISYKDYDWNLNN